MIQIWQLDKTDIINLIAHHFGVDEKDVFLDCYMESVGCGMNEHDEPCVRASVHMNMKRG